MSTLLGVLLGILAVVGAFGFIIFIHEMGHFLTARSVDIRCPQFAIGFGPSLFSFRWRGTNFAVRLFPLGGYVLMNDGEGLRADEEDPWAAAVDHYLSSAIFPASPANLLELLDKVPEAERGEAWTEVHDQVAYARTKEFPTLRSVEGNFHDRSIPARILVISGGVLMNFAATILILWGLSPFVGIGSFFNDWGAVVSQVVDNSPAAGAGVVSGDQIVSVDGRTVETYPEAYENIGRVLGEPLSLGLKKRDGSNDVVNLVPMLAIGTDSYLVDEKGRLSLKSSTAHPELVGKIVSSPTMAELLASVQAPKATSYGIRFEGDNKETTFPLSKNFRSPRGQIGVLFGVSDIRFERDLTVTVGSVFPGSPAEVAGLQAGDKIYMVGGLPLTSNSEEAFGSLADQALHAHSRLIDPQDLDVLVLREDVLKELTVANAASITSLKALGVTLVPQTTSDRLSAPFRLISGMMVMPYRILRAWLTSEYSGKEIVENMQGPIGIMQLLYQISDNGVFQFFFFMALLNAAIGAFNLLPFPALDGARLVFLVLAAIRRKPVAPETEAKVHMIGLMVLLLFVVVVSFGDVRRLISSHLFVL